MTALAGFWSFGGGGEPTRTCERMLQAQRIYAPDPPARWSGGRIAIGRALAKSLPEDRFDRGAVSGGGGSRMLVADGRLDNREELCDALGISASEAAMMADSHILMRALDRWDEEAVDRLVGDFAFACWDEARQRLLLARDFAGQRPLHYHKGRDFFAFASMPKGLHALEAVPPEPNQEAVAQFVALLPESGPDTYWKRIERVLPGHLLVVTPEGLASRRYWNPVRRELRLARAEEYEEGLREQMDRAVRVRLRGTGGRVASHLSAGLDSSAVAATAARLLAPEGGSVTAYTSVPREGFDGRGIGTSIADEGPLAASVAALYPNIEHVRIRTGAMSPLDKLDPFFFLFERPFLNLCNGTWSAAILDDAKARRLPVLLTGQAGNMTISYDGMQHLAELARQGRLLRLSKLAASLIGNGTRVGTVAAQVFGPFLPVSLWDAVRRARGKGQSVIQTTAINQSQLPALERLAKERALDFSYRPRTDPWETRLWVMGRVDHGNYAKGMLGGWGVDVRDPTADRRLAEWCLSVPAAQFLHGGVPRSLARRAFRDRLPAEVLDERRKGYQLADWHEGLSAARPALEMEVERLRAVDPAGETLDLERMEKLLADWPEGGWHTDEVMRKYRLALLRGVSAGHFLRRASGSNA